MVMVMVDTTTAPNYQDQPSGAIPVRLVTANGAAFYSAAGSGGGAGPYVYTPLGYQQITVSALSSLTVPTGATVAYISVETAAVRYRDDGTNPTSAVGMPVSVGQQLVYSGNLAAIKFIAQTGTPVLDVSYYR
jgi:hypothetical protein